MIKKDVAAQTPVDAQQRACQEPAPRTAPGEFRRWDAKFATVGTRLCSTTASENSVDELNLEHLQVKSTAGTCRCMVAGTPITEELLQEVAARPASAAAPLPATRHNCHDPAAAPFTLPLLGCGALPREAPLANVGLTWWDSPGRQSPTAASTGPERRRSSLTQPSWCRTRAPKRM